MNDGREGRGGGAKEGTANGGHALTSVHLCKPCTKLNREGEQVPEVHIFCYCVLENITLLGRLCTRSNIQQEQHGGSSAKQKQWPGCYFCPGTQVNEKQGSANFKILDR